MINYDEMSKEIKERDIMLKQMMIEMRENSKKYQEESKIHYEKTKKQLEEHRGLLKYTLSEDEKQRIAAMSRSELLVEMQKNVDEISKQIDSFIKKWGDK